VEGREREAPQPAPGGSLREAAGEGDGFLKSASVDGRPLELPTKEGQGMVEGSVESHMSFKYLGARMQGKQEVEQFQVTVKDVMDLVITLRVAHPSMQAPDEAEAHFNLRFIYLKVSPGPLVRIAPAHPCSPRNLAILQCSASVLPCHV